ncbi:MAG: hypothetical protein JXM79_22585 [Sedimentisphaerales bacterium]|nr:hypothetical protein [Sedimentisphaerales bacterium]
MKPKPNYRLSVLAIGMSVALTGSFLSSSAGSTGTLPAVKAVDNPCLKFLPRDAWVVGNVDVKVLIDFMMQGSEQNPAMEMVVVQYAEMFKGFTGIDFRTEVRYLTFCLAGDVKSEPQGLMVVKGSFNGAVSEMRLSLGIGAGLQKTTYREKTLYENPDMGYGFPELSTLIVGTPSLLRKAIDVLATQDQPMSPTLRKTLTKTNGASIVWAAVKPEVILETDEIASERQRYPELFSQVSQLECASFFSEPAADGLLVTALGCVKDPQSASDLYAFLTDSKRNTLDVDGANVFLGSFLVLSDVTLDGQFVRWDVRLTEQALKKLWETKFVRKLRTTVK